MDSEEFEHIFRRKFIFISEKILKCGLSKAKTRYIQNLADFLLEKPDFLNDLKAKNSEELIESLKKIKGIGIWSASIFALFYLNHPNIYVWGDSSLVKAISLIYKIEKFESNKLHDIIKKWDPFKSTACLILWEWLDDYK